LEVKIMRWIVERNTSGGVYKPLIVIDPNSRTPMDEARAKAWAEWYNANHARVNSERGRPTYMNFRAAPDPGLASASDAN
jgi:hypothetical protein